MGLEPQLAPYFASVKGVTQTLIGTYNGVKLTVPISSGQLIPGLALQTGGVDTSDNYFKVVTHKFHQAWLAQINQPNFVLPEPRQNLGTAPANTSAVSFNTENIILSEGLFIFKTDSNLFDNASEQPSSAITREIAAEIDLEGRNEPPV